MNLHHSMGIRSLLISLNYTLFIINIDIRNECIYCHAFFLLNLHSTFSCLNISHVCCQKTDDKSIYGTLIWCKPNLYYYIYNLEIMVSESHLITKISNKLDNKYFQNFGTRYISKKEDPNDTSLVSWPLFQLNDFFLSITNMFDLKHALFQESLYFVSFNIIYLWKVRMKSKW